jgi:diguanylate cyclase (GGDEF)-like protein/PAS domain S-box-containing protein
MIDWKQQILDNICTGIAVVDSARQVIYWNKEMERLSEIAGPDAVGVDIAVLCPKLAESRYKDILDNVFTAGQSRFCSSAFHKSFVLPKNGKDADILRQNMMIEPIWNNDKVEYAFLHISDITEHTKNERKLRDLNDKLCEGYRSVKAAERAAREIAKYDNLTGTFNRSAMKCEIEKIIGRLDAGNGKLALLFIDLDSFKHINDTYGHIVGDALLQNVAGRLLNNTRHGKYRYYDIVARIGGDEFVIALSDVKDLVDIARLTDKVLNVIRKPFFIGNDRLCISASIGIAVYPDDASSIDDLIDMADKAMYRTKRSGKNAYRFYRLQRQTSCS